MEPLYYFIHEHTAGLYKIIFSSPFFFIDYWSFIHFGSGVSLMLAARVLKLKRIWSSIFLILFAYELLELAFIFLSVRIFKPETLPDQVTDIVIGLLGALFGARLSALPFRALIVRLLEWLSRGRRLDLLTATLLACVWVWYYGYHYNFDFLNSPCVNWWAFTLWSSGLFVTIRLYRYLRRSLGIPASTAATWLLILAATFAIEYFGYSVLRIRETGGYPPLFLDMIHGTPLLKFCYLVAAPTAITGSAVSAWAVSAIRHRIRYSRAQSPSRNIMRSPETGAPCEF